MTAPPTSQPARVFTDPCPSCGHDEAAVVDATTVACVGRVPEPDTARWRRCGYELTVPS